MQNKTVRNLRKNATDTERKLWQLLRSRQLSGYKFRRQHPIGPYVADFVCAEYRLIIEADGSQHADNTKDVLRTAWLEQEGWEVMRFWNNEILENTDGVLLMIGNKLKSKQPIFRKKTQ